MLLKKLSDIFNITYGTKFDMNKMSISKASDIAFVSRSSKNNGVVNFVDKYKNIEPIQAGHITVTLGGTYLLSSFLQTRDFYTAQNVAVLKAKKNLSDQQKLFYCLCIEKNRYRYGAFGREANRTLKEILVPDISEIPNWIDDFDISQFDNAWKPLIEKETTELNTEQWRSFRISDLFQIFKGERLTKNNQILGSIPLITAGEDNNGIAAKIDFERFKDSKKYFKNTLTIDMFFNTFYHDYIYFSDDNIHTLIIKEEYEIYLNKYIYLFIATVLNKNKFKYSYGRQVRLSRLANESINLPVDKNGDPNWKLMNDYIKTIPYSSSI